jgi:hypothetical protein
VGVELDVMTVKELEKGGLPEAGLKLHDAPVGSPLVHDKLTDCVEPVCRVVVIVFEPELP